MTTSVNRAADILRDHKLYFQADIRCCAFQLTILLISVYRKNIS